MKVNKVKEKSTNRIAPSHKKNLDHLKLFFSRADVRRRIIEIRTSLKIPASGFDFSEEEPSKKLQEWYKDMHEQPGNGLDIATRRILEEYELPIHYEDSVRTYILSGIPTAPPLPFSIVTFPSEESKVAKEIILKFYSRLTDDDLKTVKAWVNSIFSISLPKSPVPIKNIDAKLMAEEMMRHKSEFDGATAKNISEDIYADLGVRLTPSQVRDASRELATLRKKIPKGKLGK